MNKQVLTVLASGVFGLTAVLGAPIGAATAQTTTHVVDVVKGAVKDVVFSEVEKAIIREHYGRRNAEERDDDDRSGRSYEREHDDDRDGDKSRKSKHKDKGPGKGKGLPPGLAKKEQLPPGLARQLEKKGTLPAGLAKRDLPADLESKLPPAPEGTERVIVDDAVVLTQKATGVVLDIIRDVIHNR